MKKIVNTAVLVAFKYDLGAAKKLPKKKDKGINDGEQHTFPLFALTLIDENFQYMLPCCELDGESDMKEQLISSFYDTAELGGNAITAQNLKQVGVYSINHKDDLEIVNAFMVFLKGTPPLEKKGEDKTPKWLNVETIIPLHGNQNEVFSDAQDKLLEYLLDPSDDMPIDEDTRGTIIKEYFPGNTDTTRPWVRSLQKGGIKIHEYLHPGVAIDLVIFGYRDTSADRRGKKTSSTEQDELSVLLTYRKKDGALEDDPWADTWSLPGTFLRVKNTAGYPDLETVREAATRVAKEKTGIDVNPEDVFYDIKPFVHTSRMGGKLRDGSPVITLPVFIPVEYQQIQGKSSLTTSDCRWFAIKRELWTENDVEGRPAPIALRGGKDGPLKLNKEGKLEKVNDVMDDNASVEVWRPEDWRPGEPESLRSPEEIGLPAADVYILDDQLVVKFYQSIVRPYRPVQDKTYDDKPALPEGAKLMTADHANIVISALQAASESLSRTLHIVSKLLNGGSFKPVKIIRMLSTWWFPWTFSRSNMDKKLKSNSLIKPVPEDGKQRCGNYTFASDAEIDRIMRDIKPL